MDKKTTRHPTLPRFGEPVPGEGGHLCGIMRGHIVGDAREPDYALISAPVPAIILPWGEYGKDVPGATSLTDGLRNTAAMLAANCPPAQHIAKLVVDGHNDYYLGARAEFWAARANVPELFDKAFHWTSTQYSRVGAFFQAFEGGNSGWDNEDVSCRVRAFRRIPLYHFDA